MSSRLCLAIIRESRREPVVQPVPRQEPENQNYGVTSFNQTIFASIDSVFKITIDGFP